MAERGVAQGVRRGKEDLAGDQAAVVDAPGQGEFCARIDDVLEDSTFVNEAEVAMERAMIADDNARVVHSRENGAESGVRVIDGGERSVLPQEAVADAATAIASDHIAVVIDRQGIGYLGIGKRDGSVGAVRQQESPDQRCAGAEAAHHCSQLVDVEQPGVGGPGIVNRGEPAVLQQQPMNAFGITLSW